MVAQLSLFDWTEKSSDATFNGDYYHSRDLTNEQKMADFNERMREREESYLPQVEDDMKRELREQLVSFTMA